MKRYNNMISGLVEKFALAGGVKRNALLQFVVSLLIAPVILLGLASCTSNDDEDNTKDNDNKQVTVTINLSTDTPSTRATITPTWTEGTTGENMKSWIVVIANQSNNEIVQVISKSDVSDLQTDTYTLSLTTGDYYFYSFANITATELGNPVVGGTANFDNMTFAVNGNGFDTSDAGIPMSNKQEITISDDTESISLWVVRMLAKVTLKFKNSTTSDITINSISLSDITKNASDNDNKPNLMLMPNAVNEEDAEACTPNLNAEDTTCVEFKHEIANNGLTVHASTTEYSDDYSVSFYVNESVAHNPSYFVVTLDTDQGVQRYALFDDWTTIARNDHHILQINLNDYKINFTVQSYTAIGVYPSVEDDGKQLSLTFHLPEEEFHIIPTVTKLSDNSSVSFSYTDDVTWSRLSDLPDKMFLNNEEPLWNSTLGYIEGVMGGTLGQRDESLYQLQIKIDDNLTLTYKVQINQDLTWYASSPSGVKDKRTSLPRQWQTVYVSE